MTIEHDDTVDANPSKTNTLINLFKEMIENTSRESCMQLFVIVFIKAKCECAIHLTRYSTKCTGVINKIIISGCHYQSSWRHQLRYYLHTVHFLPNGLCSGKKFYFTDFFFGHLGAVVANCERSTEK